MKINDRFSIYQDPKNARCWIIAESRPKSPARLRYYPTLERACLAALELTNCVGDAEALRDVVEAIDTAKAEIVAAISAHDATRHEVCRPAAIEGGGMHDG